MNKNLFNENNAVQKCLIFRHTDEAPRFTRKFTGSRKLSANLSTEKVGMFCIAVGAITLQRPLGIIS
jgi:hypothetical protein